MADRWCDTTWGSVWALPSSSSYSSWLLLGSYWLNGAMMDRNLSRRNPNKSRNLAMGGVARMSVLWICEVRNKELTHEMEPTLLIYWWTFLTCSSRSLLFRLTGQTNRIADISHLENWRKKPTMLSLLAVSAKKFPTILLFWLTNCLLINYYNYSLLTGGSS